MNLENLQIIFPVFGILGLIFAILTFVFIKKKPQGNEKIVAIAAEIHKGAMVFLRREYTYIFVFIVIVFILLALFLSIWTALAFFGGAFCSMLAGFIGMKAATRSAGRACHGAITGGTPEALMIAFKGGSVMGMTVASLGVLGLGVVYFLTKKPEIINGFAMGASSIALFARVGGGVYTKSADVGADLVGKVEAGIPEDDPRNPGVIADNVGDNVGDTAGMGADLFESYVGSVIASMAIGFSMFVNDGDNQLLYMTFPLLLITIGLLSSFLGILSISILKNFSPKAALNYSTYISGLLFIVGAFFAIKITGMQFSAFWTVVTGLLCGLLIAAESEFFTSGSPIKKLAAQAESGPATIIIYGLALGFESTILPIITISIAIFIAYWSLGLYGIAIAAVSMLSTIGITMSTDSYGPIADNAGGIAEMSGAGPEIRKITDKLDALGNTTAAIGKGFAIGSAALTALALFSAYKESAEIKIIDLSHPTTVIGLLLGALLPFIIAALTMKSVGKAANKMVFEIRRQFKEIKGLLEGTGKPDTESCIDIVTKAALKEMILPGITAVVSPIIVGVLLGKEAVGGFLAGATATGVLLGIMMSNGGGAWDNAKKYIEEGNLGGKGSDAHKAAVVGDTVGDPFKDTTGPSMNILIKLMSVVALVAAPVLAKFSGILTGLLE
ncbi:MAG: sodium-translocating pyrophosphatase [bacterium]|nr:sodium-translocating pyrophosphatase [bacterium]